VTGMSMDGHWSMTGHWSFAPLPAIERALRALPRRTQLSEETYEATLFKYLECFRWAYLTQRTHPGVPNAQRSVGRAQVRRLLDDAAYHLEHLAGLFEYFPWEARIILSQIWRENFGATKNLENFCRDLAAALRAADTSQLPQRARRSRGYHKEAVEHFCASAFREITGRLPGFTRAPDTGEMHGAFYDLVAAVFQAMGIKDKASTSVRTIVATLHQSKYD